MIFSNIKLDSGRNMKFETYIYIYIFFLRNQFETNFKFRLLQECNLEKNIKKKNRNSHLS